jgi:hypothetical protein
LRRELLPQFSTAHISHGWEALLKRVVRLTPAVHGAAIAAPGIILPGSPPPDIPRPAKLKTLDKILDCFAGGGSTLIAAEKTGRQARLVELDPAYCDVIVQRWERFTGSKPVRESAAADRAPTSPALEEEHA